MSAFSSLQVPLPQTLRRSYPIATQLSGGWRPADLEKQRGWRKEIEWAALVELMNVVRETLPLPIESLHGGLLQSERVDLLVQEIRTELYAGSGVVWLQGLTGLSENLLRRAYTFLSMKIGTPIDTYGRLYDVKDTGQSYLDKAIPVSQTRAETTFHTDSSNVHVEPAAVSLLCVRPALSGGSSLVSSAITAHQDLSENTLRLLYRDYVRNIVTPGLSSADVFKNRFPVFRWSEQEGLVMRYMRYWMEKGHERIGWPLSDAEMQALDLLDATLIQNQVRFDLRAGDMVWVNNRTVTHNRTAFEDDPVNPRLLVRMWLSKNPS
jgi:alpha-ketoglutarate-dependent taurine dioxygenase